MKVVAFIPADAFVKGQGFRVSLVVDGEDGHRPTGTWPYTGAVGESMPWFWGDDYKKACAIADDYNLSRGISPDEARAIVARSVEAQMRRQGGKKRHRKDIDVVRDAIRKPKGKT
jgi:hypothetical protein